MAGKGSAPTARGPLGRSAQGGRRRARKTDAEDAEVRNLEATIEAGKPEPGTNPLALAASESGGYASARTFEELPLSRATLQGLREHKFVTLTTIQRAAMPHALAGRDVLGAAKTGSGKTLAFLIPVGALGSGQHDGPCIEAE
jgi:ATP-dependent RNA helicase DDX10/DBP4